MPSERRKIGPRAQGRPPKHGARALARALATGKLDRRTGVARDKAAMLDAVGADEGGWSRMTARAQLTAEIGVDAVLICRTIVNYAFTNGLFEQGPDGLRLIPAVAKGLATYQGVATRAFTALGMRPDKVDRLPDLSQYIAARQQSPRDASTAPLSSAASTAVAEAVDDGSGESRAVACAPGVPSPTPSATSSASTQLDETQASESKPEQKPETEEEENTHEGAAPC